MGDAAKVEKFKTMKNILVKFHFHLGSTKILSEAQTGEASCLKTKDALKVMLLEILVKAQPGKASFLTISYAKEFYLLTVNQFHFAIIKIKRAFPLICQYLTLTTFKALRTYSPLSLMNSS